MEAILLLLFTELAKLEGASAPAATATLNLEWLSLLSYLWPRLVVQQDLHQKCTHLTGLYGTHNALSTAPSSACATARKVVIVIPFQQVARTFCGNPLQRTLDGK